MGRYNGVVKRLMMEYAFQHVGRILFFVAKDNFRSQKAVEKLVLLDGIDLSIEKRVESGEENITYIIKKTKLSSNND